MLLSLLAVVTAIQAPPAAAHAVTYSCRFNDPGTGEVRFTLDETTSMISMYVPATNHRETMIGFFSRENVTFGNNLIDYVMNRAQGSITRSVPKAHVSQGGFCVPA
jgi:hypothetical protein